MEIALFVRLSERDRLKPTLVRRAADMATKAKKPAKKTAKKPAKKAKK